MKSEQRINRLFIECTHTYLYGGNSGIQRVTRSIANNCAKTGRKLGVHCCPVILRRNSFFRIKKISTSATRLNQINTFCLNLYHRIRFILRSILPYWFLSHRGLPMRVWKLAKTMLKSLLRLIHYALTPMQGKISFGPADALLLLDSSWHLPLWRAVDKARKRGAKVGFVLYDLIPVLAPEFCEASLVQVFRKWVKRASCTCDFGLTISESVSREFDSFVKSSSWQGEVSLGKLRSFRLGGQVDPIRGNGKVRGHVSAVFDCSSGPKPYITVSTIEPRKNHGYLLDAFDIVWAHGVDARLCLIGKIGWLCEEIVDRIRDHAYWQKRLFMFNDLNDAELAYCYENCKGLIYCPVREGFGLPVVEALNKGVPVLASDIPVLREVGGEHCSYFDLSSERALAELVMQFEQKRSSVGRQCMKSYRWPDWQESCEELLRTVVESAGDVMQD